MFDEYKSLRDMLRTTAFSLSESDKSSIPDFESFRRKYFGKLKISNNATRGADSLYMELCSEYPEFFDDSITNPADQVIKMAEVRDLISPKALDIDIEDAGNAIAAELIASLIDADTSHIDQTVIERVKEEYKKKAEELKKKYNAKLEEYREERRDREDREKLLKLARELSKMRSTPENEARVRELVGDLDTMGINIIEKGYTRADGVRNMDRLDLAKLKEEYAKAKEEDPDFETNRYIEEKIERLDKVQIGTMEIIEVRELIEVLQAVKHEIRTAKKLINDTQRREAYATGIEVMNEIEYGKGVNVKEKLKYFGAEYNVMHLSAERMARRIVGYKKDSVLVELIEKLSEGERKALAFEQKSTGFFDTLVSDAKNMERISGKRADIIEVVIKGQKIKITPAMRISLYLHSKSPANMMHIKKGGITIPDIELYQDGKTKDAYGGTPIRLEARDIKIITDKMSDFEIRFAELASKWLNGMCREALNETSLNLLGYEVARVNNYMPINSNSDFTKSDSLIFDGTIEGMGMLKEREGGVNPILLVDIISVIERQMEGVSRYYGLAIPIKNFNKVYNTTEKGQKRSVKGVLRRKWGTNAETYMENLLKDLQKQRKTESTVFDKLRGDYAGAVLTMNISSAFKQVSGYTAGGSVLGWDAIVKGFHKKLTESDRKIINKYTPLLWAREQGYTMREIGDYATGQDSISKKLPWAYGWLQKMDIWTAERLWKASEVYVNNKTELEKGSEAYYKEVAKIFNKAICETQPNYTVMQQADIMRNPNPLVKSITMFQTQARQNYNILYDAIGEYEAACKSGDKEWKKETGKTLGNAVSSQVVSAVITVAAAFVADIVLGRDDKWKDEKEKYTTKSVVGRGAETFASSLLGSLVGGDEVMGLVSAIFGGGAWYDVGVPGIDMMNDLASGIIRIGSAIRGEDRKDIRAYIQPVTGLLKQVAMMFGQPAANVEKLAKGIFGHALSAAEKLVVDTEWVEYQIMKINTPLSKKSQYGNFLRELMEKAYAAEDENEKLRLYKAASDISEDMKKLGIDVEYIQSCVDKVAKKIDNENNQQFTAYEEDTSMGVWSRVARGKNWLLKNRVYENLIESEIARLEGNKLNTDYSDNMLESERGKEVTYDGTVYRLDPKTERKYNTAIDDTTTEYYKRIVEENENINAVFNGETEFKNLSKSQKERLKEYLIYQRDSGKITDAKMRELKGKYERGEIKAPIIETYVEEYVTFDRLPEDRRKTIISDAKKKYKAIDDRDGYNQYREDVLSGKVKFEKRRYLYEDYADLDDKTKKKVLNKIENKAIKKVQEEMRDEIIGADR